MDWAWSMTLREKISGLRSREISQIVFDSLDRKGT